MLPLIDDASEWQVELSELLQGMDLTLWSPESMEPFGSVVEERAGTKCQIKISQGGENWERGERRGRVCLQALAR
jgi:hypothetical protein